MKICKNIKSTKLKEPQIEKKNTFQEVTTKTDGTLRRTSALFDRIDDLMDNRGFVHKMFGFLIQDLDSKDLSENFAQVKKRFKKFEEFHISIPEDILSNFELSDRFPVFEPAYITKAQAEELRKLASEGESLLQEKIDELKITYGPFQAGEIVLNVAQHLTPQEVRKFLLISTSFKKLVKPALVLTSIDLSQPDLSEKIAFARANSLMLNIKLESDIDVKTMITFIKNSANSDLLERIAAFQLRSTINYLNVNEVNVLLNLLAQSSFPNLTSLSFGEIRTSLILPAFKNITSLSFGDISSPLTLPAFPEMTSLSFGDIWSTLTLPAFENITSLSFGKIWSTLTLPAFPEMTSLSFGDICSTLTLPAFEKMTSLSFGEIYIPLTLPAFEDMTSLSFGNIRSSLTLAKFPNMTSLAFGKIWISLTLPAFENMTSLSFGDIWDFLTLPAFEKMTTLSFGNIHIPLTLPAFPNMTSLSFNKIDVSVLLLRAFPMMTSFFFGKIIIPLTFLFW